jgi:5-methylcytosine-specific restriction protein A
MATYLLTWNPEKSSSDWNNQNHLQRDIKRLRTQGHCPGVWSCGVTKRIKRGDRVFLIRIGRQPPCGIVASGWVTSQGVWVGLHWDTQKRRQGKTALYVDIDFDNIVNPAANIFSLARLSQGIYAKKNWTPPASGTTIPNEIAVVLEQDWAAFLNRLAQHPTSG